MSIPDLLKAKTVLSLEVFPPKRDGDVEALYRVFDAVAPLKPDFISVTYGAGGGNVGPHFDITRRLLSLGITPLPHFTCVGLDRDAVRRQLDRLAEAGVRNLLALRGDPPKGAVGFEPPADGFAHASDLIAFIRARYPFRIGGAFYPEKHPESPDAGADLRALKLKVEAGAEFLISQMFFDNNVYTSFVRKAREAGIAVPLIPGIYPVVSARFFDRDFSVGLPPEFRGGFRGTDPAADREFGWDYAQRQCLDLLRSGAPGLHLFVMNRSDTALRLWPALAARIAAPSA